MNEPSDDCYPRSNHAIAQRDSLATARQDGHDVGDRALIAFTDAMRGKTRDDDLVVRLGGEEFCVLLPRTDVAETGQVAERIRVQCADTAIDGIDGRLSVSFGVVGWQTGWDIDDLLCAADQALYRAKRGGRNRVGIAEVHGETGAASCRVAPRHQPDDETNA